MNNNEKTYTVTAMGHDGTSAIPCRITLKTSGGIGIHMAGNLCDRDIKEILLRVCTALHSMGVGIPGKKMIFSIEDADKVTGSKAFLDLGIAVAILMAAGKIPSDAADGLSFFGSLSLDGDLRICEGIQQIETCSAPVIVPEYDTKQHLPENLHQVSSLSRLVTILNHN